MGAYSTAVIADGASHYWRLGEASGTTAADQIVAGNAPGTISGGVTLGQPGPLADGSTAMTFNGTTGKIATAAAVPLPVTVTLEAWMHTTFTAVKQTLVGNYPAATGGALLFGILPTIGKLEFYSPVGGSDLNGTVVLTDGLWHHVVGIQTGTTSLVYVDGALDTSGASARTSSSSDVFVVGAYTNNTNWMNGALAEVAIYPTALTPAQIAAHYALRTATGAAATGRPISLGMWQQVLP